MVAIRITKIRIQTVRQLDSFLIKTFATNLIRFTGWADGEAEEDDEDGDDDLW